MKTVFNCGKLSSLGEVNFNKLHIGAFIFLMLLCYFNFFA